MTNPTGNDGERFTGHGAEWRDSNLSAAEAQQATSWVEQKIDKRSMLTNKDRVHDIRDAMWELEKDGEIMVHRVEDQQLKAPVHHHAEAPSCYLKFGGHLGV